MSRLIADYRKPWFGYKDKLFEELAYKLYYRPKKEEFPVYGDDLNYEVTLISAILASLSLRLRFLDFEKSSQIKGL